MYGLTGAYSFISIFYHIIKYGITNLLPITVLETTKLLIFSETNLLNFFKILLLYEIINIGNHLLPLQLLQFRIAIQ